MSTGIQEIVALMLVIAVVALALFRHRRQGHKQAGCGDACVKTGGQSDEATVHFYRRNKDQ